MVDSGFSSTTFSSVRFCFSGFNPIDENSLRRKLESGGGVDVSQNSQTCTHLIVDKLLFDDPICVSARSNGKVVVTGLWVHHCFDIGILLDANSVIYRPLKDLNGIPGAKSLVVCLTGYVRQDREDIMAMVELMGGQFSKPLVANRVTHLVCYKFEGEKYELAKRMKRIKLINHRWLEECLKNWKLIPEDDYEISGYELEIMEASANDSEDEAENASVKRANKSPLGLRVAAVAAVEMSKPEGKDIQIVQTNSGAQEGSSSKDKWLTPKKTDRPFEAMVSTNAGVAEQQNYQIASTFQDTSNYSSHISVANRTPEKGMSRMETDGLTSVRRHSSLATYSRKTLQTSPEPNTLGKESSGRQNSSLRMDDKDLKASTAFNISASKSGSSMERTTFFEDLDKIDKLHGEQSPPMLPQVKLTDGAVSSKGSPKVHHNSEASITPPASLLFQELRPGSSKENVRPVPSFSDPTDSGEAGHKSPGSVLNTKLSSSNVVPMEDAVSSVENIISKGAGDEIPKRSSTEAIVGNILLQEPRSGSPKQNLRVVPNISDLIEGREAAHNLDLSDSAAKFFNQSVVPMEAAMWTPDNITLKGILEEVPERSVTEPEIRRSSTSPGSGLIGMKDKLETELTKKKPAPRKSLGTRGRRKNPINQKGSIYLSEPTPKDEHTDCLNKEVLAPATDNDNQKEVSSPVLNTEVVPEVAKHIESETEALKGIDSVDKKSYAPEEKDHLVMVNLDKLQAKTPEEADAEVETTMLEPELSDVPTKDPSDGALQLEADKSKSKRKREATVGKNSFQSGKKESSSTAKVGKSSVKKSKKSIKEDDGKANDTLMKEISADEKENLASGNVSSGRDQSRVAGETLARKETAAKDPSDGALQLEVDKSKSKRKRETTVGKNSLQSGKKESSSTAKVGKSSVKKSKKSIKEDDGKANDTLMKEISADEKENLASGNVSSGRDQSRVAGETLARKETAAKDPSDASVKSVVGKNKGKRRKEADVEENRLQKPGVKKAKISKKEADAKANNTVMKDTRMNSAEVKENKAVDKESGDVSSDGTQSPVVVKSLARKKAAAKDPKEAIVERSLQSGKKGSSSTAEVGKSSCVNKTKKSKKGDSDTVMKEIGDSSAKVKENIAVVNTSGKAGSGGDQSSVSGKPLARKKVAKSAKTGTKAVKESKQLSVKPSASRKALQDQEQEPKFFTVSGPRPQRNEYQKIIRRLKGKCCRDSHQWSYQATHFIASEIRRTEKFFAAAASGSWILKTDYVADSKEAGKLLPEEPYEWHSTGLSADGAINLEAPRKWRLVREQTGHGALYGLRIVVYGDCTIPSLDTLKRAVKAGDGTILATAPPYTRFLNQNTDLALISPGIPRDDVWIQEFIRHEIPCVLADYLVEYVCKPGYALDKHVLYNTNSWAEKSFNKMQLSANESVSF